MQHFPAAPTLSSEYDGELAVANEYRIKTVHEFQKNFALK